MNPWARFATVMVSAAAIGVAWVAVDATLLVDEEAAITIATPEPTAPTAEPMPQGEEFITTWTGLRVQLPLIPNGEYDFFVDWDADGNADANITEWDSPAAQRVFDTDGPHTVTIVGEIIGWSYAFHDPSSSSFSQIGDPRLLGTDDAVAFAGDLPLVDATTLTSVEQWGPLATGAVAGLMYGAQNLKVNATDAPKISIPTLAYAFYNTGVDTISASEWDLTGVEDITSMFENAQSFNDPGVTTWDTSSVQRANSTFTTALAFNQDISSWDVSAAVDMSSFLAGAGSFDQDLSAWELEGVAVMGSWLTNAGMSASNYTASLLAWADRPSTATGVNAYSGLVDVTAQMEDAQKALRSNFDWSFEPTADQGFDIAVPPQTKFTDAQIQILTDLFNRTDFGKESVEAYLEGKTKAYRTAIEDGVQIPVDADVNPERVNLVYIDGLLVDAFFG